MSGEELGIVEPDYFLKYNPSPDLLGGVFDPEMSVNFQNQPFPQCNSLKI